LIPDRSRVLVAKLLASIVLGSRRSCSAWPRPRRPPRWAVPTSRAPGPMVRNSSCRRWCTSSPA
jgi:hypothetical protein